MTEKQSEWAEKVIRITDAYCDVVETGLRERWGSFPVDLYNVEISEVIGGLMARQATLTVHLAVCPTAWTGHLAPLVLRSMADAHISLAWILKEPESRSKAYILYGLGQEKLLIENYKAEPQGATEIDKAIGELIRLKEAWLISQRHEFLTEVNVGQWSGLSMRQMALEAECEGLYKFAYTPFSAVVHNMWQHVSIYNLERCKNPLHKYHGVPTIREVPLDIDYLYRSSKYVSRSFEAVDDRFNLSHTSPIPCLWLAERLKQEFSSDGGSTEDRDTYQV